MGLTIAVTLIVQSTSCRVQWQHVLLSLVLWGTFAGGFGSLVRMHALTCVLPSTDWGYQLDSLLGATLQRTRFVNATKRIWTEDAGALDPKTDVKVISGLDILTNNQVSV